MIDLILTYFIKIGREKLHAQQVGRNHSHWWDLSHMSPTNVSGCAQIMHNFLCRDQPPIKFVLHVCLCNFTE